MNKKIRIMLPILGMVSSIFGLLELFEYGGEFLFVPLILGGFFVVCLNVLVEEIKK